MNKIRFIWEELKSSFWFVPSLIICLSIAAAFFLVSMDKMLSYEPEGIIRYVFPGSIQSARAVLSIISAAMIGVAGTVFSITLVALTLASSQFGSRLLRNFMHERLNQVVLGTYISTYVYCLIVLNTVKDNEQLSFIPNFSILVAILATIANIVLLIFFIHHISVSIQAEKVISDIYQSLGKNLDTLFPENIGESPADRQEEMDESKHIEKFPYKESSRSSKSGYIQYLDEEGLMRMASEHDLLIQMNSRPGDYIVHSASLADIYCKSEIEEGLAERIAKNYILGSSRTPQQDLEYAIYQLVEIASRALSPGINDPFTAIACIDNLSSILARLAQRKFPSKYRHDENGQLRVIADILTYEGVMNAAFNQIRQYGSGTPSVLIRLLESLQAILKFTQIEEQRLAIKKHAQMVYSLAQRSIDEPNDLEDLNSRYELLLKDLEK